MKYYKYKTLKKGTIKKLKCMYNIFLRNINIYYFL